MANSQNESAKLEYTELVEALNKMTEALTRHSDDLKQHKTTMDHLTSVVEQLNSTIRQEIKAGAESPSIHLKRVIIEFVESQINPHFYQIPNTPMLTSTPKITRISLPAGQKKRLKD